MKLFLFLTGFTSFANVAENPTEGLIGSLSSPEFKSNRLDEDIEIVDARVMDVTVEAVGQESKAYLAQALAKAREGDRVIIIHFGVAPHDHYRLERTGHNEMTFSVPDNAGFQPANEPISDNLPVGEGLRSDLDLEALCAEVQQRGFPTTAVSDDAGRYLCNYTLFTSLLGTQEESNLSALFVHVPPLELSSAEETLDFATNLLNALCALEHAKALSSAPSSLRRRRSSKSEGKEPSATEEGDDMLTRSRTHSSSRTYSSEVVPPDSLAHSVIAALQEMGFDEEQAREALSLGATTPDEALALILGEVDALVPVGTSFPLLEAEGDASFERTKLVIVVREDLGLSPGKLAAQSCHAALGAYREGLNDPHTLAVWEEQGEPTIVLSCPSLGDLEQLQTNAEMAGLPVSRVKDAGRTEVEPGTVTVIAIGPAPVSRIDPVTGCLPLA